MFEAVGLDSRNIIRWTAPLRLPERQTLSKVWRFC